MNGYFFNRRPRGFRHTFRFSDERRDLLDSLRSGVPPEVLAERSLREPQAGGGCGSVRRRGRPFAVLWIAMAAFMLLVLLAVSLLT